MKIPYAISDFEDCILSGYYYVDRTDRIALMEQVGKYLLFLRPRRFGKSLWLTTLKNYYDLARKEKFGQLRTYTVIAVGFERIIYEEV